MCIVDENISNRINNSTTTLFLLSLPNGGIIESYSSYPADWLGIGFLIDFFFVKLFKAWGNKPTFNAFYL